jgi:hypothetical protein
LQAAQRRNRFYPHITTSKEPTSSSPTPYAAPYSEKA